MQNRSVKPWRVATLGPVIVLAVACGAPTRPLPAVNAFNGNCRGVGFDGHIKGDPTDDRLAWLVSDLDGARVEIVWPPGYAARFTPRLEVIDEEGDVVFRDGDGVNGACTTGAEAEGPLLMLPRFWE